MAENKVVDSSLNCDISLNDTLEILEETKFEMSMEQLQDLINNFLPQDKLGLDMNKFDFRILTAEYYQQKFPGFDPCVYPILEKCSEIKVGSMEEDKPGMSIKQGEFKVSFS